MAVRGLFVMLAVALGVGGCATGSTPTGSALDVPTVPPPASAAAVPSEPSPGVSPPAIVGEWVGTHDCERIVSMLKDAGLDDYIAEQVNGNGLVPGVDAQSDLLDPSSPCAEAVPRSAR